MFDNDSNFDDQLYRQKRHTTNDGRSMVDRTQKDESSSPISEEPLNNIVGAVGQVNVALTHWPKGGSISI